MKKLLIIMFFFIIECKTSQQDSPIKKAIENDNAEHVFQYIQDGANLHPRNGPSLLDYAIEHNSIQSIKLLLNAGAKRSCGQIITKSPQVFALLLQADAQKKRKT